MGGRFPVWPRTHRDRLAPEEQVPRGLPPLALPSRGEAISKDEGKHPSQVLRRDDQHDEAREQQAQQTE
jgi:hypothetical protein